MSMKKTAVTAVTLVAVAGGSSAYGSPSPTASAGGDTVGAERTARSIMQAHPDAGDAVASRRCVGKRQVRRMRPYQSLRKVRRILGGDGHKVGGAKLRGWNTCYDSEDLYLSFYRKGGALIVYDINTPQAPFV